MSGTEISFSTGRPLTVSDLRRLVERCGEFGIPDSSELKAQVSLGGKLRRLTVRELPSAALAPPKDEGHFEG